MTVAWPHHACVPLSKRRQHRPPSRALDLCGCPRNALWVVLVNTHTSKSQEFGRNSVAFSLAMSVCATPVLQP